MVAAIPSYPYKSSEKVGHGVLQLFPFSSKQNNLLSMGSADRNTTKDTFMVGLSSISSYTFRMWEQEMDLRQSYGFCLAFFQKKNPPSKSQQQEIWRSLCLSRAPKKGLSVTYIACVLWAETKGRCSYGFLRLFFIEISVRRWYGLRVLRTGFEKYMSVCELKKPT
jgi:hypothetical protein